MLWSFLGGLAGGLFKALFGWLTGRQTRRDQIELGQERQANKQHEVAAQATKDMQAAQAGPRGREVTEESMRNGGF